MTGALRVSVQWHNAGPHTIWAKLAERLGREPTDKEAATEIKRILSEGSKFSYPGIPEHCRRCFPARCAGATKGTRLAPAPPTDGGT